MEVEIGFDEQILLCHNEGNRRLSRSGDSKVAAVALSSTQSCVLQQ